MRELFFLIFILIIILCLSGESIAWTSSSSSSPTTTDSKHVASRREILSESTHFIISAAFLPSFSSPKVAIASSPSSGGGGDFSTLFDKVKEARSQLNVVPKLIDDAKWDSVRAVLIEPPLADCWAKTSRPLLTNYAEALGDVGGDELAALEAREDAVSHLRYLDMAVYNNIFNPIATVGKTGSSERLIRSYYEDPINEYKASVAALDELVKLSKDL